MADPPSISVQQERPEQREVINTNETVTTLESKSSSGSSDSENKPIEGGPLADLSALKLSHTSIRERSMPLSRQRSKVSTPEGVPLMNSESKAHTSGKLKLPLPPENTPLRRMSLGSSNSTVGSQPTPTAKPSPLTRKAQRYSSLKKKKNNPSPTKIFNRLFCNNPMRSNDDVEESDSAEENRSPRSSSKMKEDDSSSCIKLGKEVLAEASESLTLRDEAKVRQTVQSNLADSILHSCAAPNASPPTLKQSTDDDSTVASKEVKLVGHAAVGSVSKGPVKFKKTVSIMDEDDDDDDIEEPSTKISMSHDDDIAETASQPLPETKPSDDSILKSKSSDEVKTPAQAKKKTMKTPGGLVIPTPFLNKGKGLFPSTIENYYTKPSVYKSPPRPSRPKSPRSGSRSPRKKTKSKLQNSPLVLSMTASTSSSMTGTTGTDSTSVEIRDVSPPPMVRITPSLEDLSTVPEASTSKETKSKEESDLDPVSKSTSSNSVNPVSKSTSSNSDSSSTDPLAAAQKMLREELLESELSMSRSDASSTSDLTEKNKFKQLNDKNEKKINELKDQVALANRLARMRLHEIERLEKIMDDMKESQVDETEMAKLRDRLEQVQSSKKKEIDRVKQEMEASMNKTIEQLKSQLVGGGSTKDEYTQRLEKELSDVKKQLSTVKSSESEVDIDKQEILQVDSGDPETEVVRLKQELADVTEKLAISSFSAKGNIMPSDYKRLVDELAVTKASLASKTEELRQLKSRKPPRSPASPSRKRGDTTPQKKELLEKVDTLECQLESERKSILQVDTKLANMKKAMEDLQNKHAKELADAKAKADGEIQQLKSELEEREALEEAMQIASNEKDVAVEEVTKLRNQIRESEKLHEQTIEQLRKQHRDDLTVVNDHHTVEMAKQQKDRTIQLKEAEMSINKSRQEYEAKVAHTTKEYEEKLKAAEVKYKSVVADSDKLLKELNKQHEAQLSELKAKHDREIKSIEMLATVGDEKLREDYNALKVKLSKQECIVKEAEENHSKQFEELLAQLDLVEAEHKQSMKAKDKALSEKEAIVEALGSQLSEAKNRMKESDLMLTKESDRTRDAQRICRDLEEQICVLEKEIETLKNAHQTFVKEAAVAQGKACEEAREEMIQKAESQFQHANEHYVKLRKQYDDTQSRVKKLENEVKTLKRKLEKAQTDKESSEVDLKAELAQANAKIAKAEADFVKKSKEYRKEMERTLQAAKEFESKAEEAEKTSKNLQTTLATLVAAKAQLQKEYEDMKSVSEELIAIVEGNQATHEC